MLSTTNNTAFLETLKTSPETSPAWFQQTIMTLFFGILLICTTQQVGAQTNTLQEITYATLPGDRVQIKLTMSEAATLPGSFTIDNPARIALDFPATQSALKRKRQSVGIGGIRTITAVEAGGRTRIVINLTKLIGYSTRVDGNNVFITLGDSSVGAMGKLTAATKDKTSSADIISVSTIRDVDFRRGVKGEGRIVVSLADPSTVIDMKKRGEQVIITLQNSKLPEALERRLDVIDFATPVRTVDAFNHGSDVRIVITASGNFEHLGYQTDDRFTVDIKPPIKEKEEKRKKRKFAYTGERLSLNFQNIEVRAVLQLIADFTGLNLVTSDTVSGNLTLRLKNVPWDQALDIILKTKGLAKRQTGNVMLIAPAEEIAAREKLELEANRQIENLAPLESESIQINYAKASDLAALLKAKGNSIVSERGNITVDERTNKLLVQDTAKNIDAMAALVQELDIPVRQVLIEARIVLATTNFSKELGIRFGVSGETVSGSRTIATSGDLASASAFAVSGTTPALNNRLNVNLPTGNPTGSIGLAIAKIPFGAILDLELSAAQAEGRSETISSPRVITANQHMARIEQGTEIPYVESSSSGATTISFKKAVLSLEVTPQITPDDRIIMDLKVNKDAPDFSNLISTGAGVGAPPIDTQNVETQVLVDNGETVVLGGVYEQTKSYSVNRVPFFGDLPLIGILFRNTIEKNDKSELLIFVTPKLLKEQLALQ